MIKTQEINLISDTVTKPTEDMLAVMMTAEVGDDVFNQDPSINSLELRIANMFKKQAALFCPSGTMTNQIAIKTHTNPLDEVICDHFSHVYQYETGGYAFNSGVTMNLINGQNGKITADQIESKIRPDFDWLPKSSLVVIENSCNKGGGSYYTLDEITPITQLCKKKGLSLHLDGARLFNVLVETGESTEDVGQLFDTISVCMSKGLGAPVGSLLVGDRDFIKQARRYRKVMGGGMRQGKILSSLNYVTAVKPIETNIVIFTLRTDLSVSEFLNNLNESGILATQFGPHEVRFVTHMGVNSEILNRLSEVLRNFE